MSNSYTPVFLHYVWSTFERQPLIARTWEPNLHAAIAEKCHKLGITQVNVGGIEDHIHVLVRLPVNISMSELARHMKGASSYVVNHDFAPGSNFRWQGAYGVTPVYARDAPRVREYVRNQRQNHERRALLAELERTVGDPGDARNEREDT